MSTEYEVKGSTIQTKYDFVQARYGPLACGKLEAVFKHKGLYPVHSSSWYSYDLYVELLESIAVGCFGGDLARLVEVGEYSANDALSSMYRAFVSEDGFLDFLDGMTSLHHMFYSHGNIEVEVHPDQKGCDIVHRHKPKAAEADQYIASGFYQKSAELHGLTNACCSFSLERRGVHFVLTWA